MVSSATPTTSSGIGAGARDYISGAKERLMGTLDTRRPWKHLFDYHAISLPRGFKDAISRIRTNLYYFRMNFAIIVLLGVFLSLIWHPVALIVFLITMIAWIFLFFLRDEPIVLFGKSIDDRIVLLVLSVLTVGILLLTGATMNILIAIGSGVLVVLIYSIFRQTDDLFLDEEDAEAGGLLAARAEFGTGKHPPAGSGSD